MIGSKRAMEFYIGGKRDQLPVMVELRPKSFSRAALARQRGQREAMSFDTTELTEHNSSIKHREDNDSDHEQ